METVQVRKATVKDADTLLLFEQGVIEAERPFDETLKREKTHYYDLPSLLSSDSAELVVATINNKLVGCGYAREEEAKPYLQHSSYAYLGFMYVLPEHRGKGINNMIIDALKTWALSKGLSELRLEVYAQNSSAIKAYEKVGFQPLMIEMRIKLEQ